jgi:hypothetical protein
MLEGSSDRSANVGRALENDRRHEGSARPSASALARNDPGVLARLTHRRTATWPASGQQGRARWAIRGSGLGSGLAERRCAVGLRHRRADRAWHARHPAYDRGRRWQEALDAVGAGAAAPTPDRRAPLAGVSWDLAQDAIEPEALVIVTGIAEVLVAYSQDEIRRQVAANLGDSGGHPRVGGGRRDGGPGAALAA